MIARCLHCTQRVDTAIHLCWFILLVLCIERHVKKLFTVIIKRELKNSSWHLYRKCVVVSLEIGDFTFNAHAQKRQPERLKRPGKCRRRGYVIMWMGSIIGYTDAPETEDVVGDGVGP